MGEGGARGRCERAPATLLWLLKFGFIFTKYQKIALIEKTNRQTKQLK